MCTIRCARVGVVLPCRFLLSPGHESRPGAVDDAPVDPREDVGSKASASFCELDDPAESRRGAPNGFEVMVVDDLESDRLPTPCPQVGRFPGSHLKVA